MEIFFPVDYNGTSRGQRKRVCSDLLKVYNINTLGYSFAITYIVE